MAAALLRSQRARVWTDILAPAAEPHAAGALWQNLRSLPAPGTTNCVGKGSQRPLQQPSAALLCQTNRAANKQQRTTEQPGQAAASQGGPGQPVKQQVKQDTLLMELRNLLAWPFHKFMAQAAATIIPKDVETEFDVLQFLEGCKGAFVAVHESMHGTRDLAPMVSLPVLRTFARIENEANKDKKYCFRIRPGSVNPGQPSIAGWALMPRSLMAYTNMARMGQRLMPMPMPGIAADDEYQDIPDKLDAKEAQMSLWTDLTRVIRQGMVVGSSLVIHVRFSGCSFVLETRDHSSGGLIQETLDQRCKTWSFGRGPLPDLTYPVREFGADLPWVVCSTK